MWKVPGQRRGDFRFILKVAVRQLLLLRSIQHRRYQMHCIVFIASQLSVEIQACSVRLFTTHTRRASTV